MGNPIRVLVVDDHEMFRVGLRALIRDQEDMAFVGEAANGQEAVEKAARLNPDVILMDINMPRLDGVQATRQITLRNANARVIMLTIYGDDEHVFEAIKAGASGYVLKDARSATLIEAIRTVHRGEVMVEPYIASRVLHEFRHLSDEVKKRQGFADLGEQEQKILEAVARGKTNREIAVEMFMSEQTVKNRLCQIYQKLKVNNRAEAVIRAIQGGFIVDGGSKS